MRDREIIEQITNVKQKRKREREFDQQKRFYCLALSCEAVESMAVAAPW